MDCQSRAPSLSRYRGFVFRRGRKSPMLDRQCSIMRRHFSVMPARNGVGRPFGTFFKHASTFNKVFGVGHCGTSLRTNSRDYMVLDFVPCRSPPAQIVVWRMLRLKPIGQGLAPSGEEAVNGATGGLLGWSSVSSTVEASVRRSSLWSFGRVIPFADRWISAVRTDRLSARSPYSASPDGMLNRSEWLCVPKTLSVLMTPRNQRRRRCSTLRDQRLIKIEFDNKLSVRRPLLEPV